MRTQVFKLSSDTVAVDFNLLDEQYRSVEGEHFGMSAGETAQTVTLYFASTDSAIETLTGLLAELKGEEQAGKGHPAFTAS